MSVPDLDLAVLVGTLSSDPVVTELASGTVLVRFEVTARQDTSTDTVPVAWFDPPRVPAFAAGDRVAAVGRVRRRFFRVGGVTRSATEVVADWVGRPRSTTRLRRALDAARQRL